MSIIIKIQITDWVKMQMKRKCVCFQHNILVIFFCFLLSKLIEIKPIFLKMKFLC